MSTVVTLLPSKVSFDVSDNQSILQAALEANVPLEYSCSTGRCGTCKVKLIKGNIKQGKYDETLMLSSEQVLTCVAFPTTDIELKATYLPELQGIQTKTVPAKVDAFSYENDSILILTLRLPPNAGLEYLPGQFVELSFKCQKRSYSLASAYINANKIELHIKKVKEGFFSDYFFNHIAKNDLFRIRGPLGSFFVRKNEAPLIFLCTGTGFAPVKAMVESLLAAGDRRPINIFWGARYRKDIYSNLPQEWALEYEQIAFTPVLSREEKILGVEAKGYVQSEVIRQCLDLKQSYVYACGASEMINDARTLLVEKGVDSEHFFSDAFISSE